MSKIKCYTSDYARGKDTRMEHAKVSRLIKNKTKMITIRIKPELLDCLDEALKKDRQCVSQNDCILKYLEVRGKV